ncbi:MAG: RNA 3'-terminal phosphate cyclase [Syntrophales bacterium]
MKEETVIIDGSMGEGGGQILRTSLSLSMITRRPCKIERIRAGRKKPGLQMQHLVALKAAQKISSATVQGAEIGSSEVYFSPGGVKGGNYELSIGSAGSVTLVLQTILPALVTAEESSHISLEGGTHNPWAPTADFLERVFLPILNRMGPTVTTTLERYGFYPAGGGCLKVDIKPVNKLTRIDLVERGEIREGKATAILACIPDTIGHREVNYIKENFNLPDNHFNVQQVASAGPGNVLSIEIVCDGITEMITAFGKRGVTSEAVARNAIFEANNYVHSGAPVGPHLADQILIPMALAKGGSFRTGPMTPHVLTNIDVIKHFLDVKIDLHPIDGKIWHVEIC